MEDVAKQETLHHVTNMPTIQQTSFAAISTTKAIVCRFDIESRNMEFENCDLVYVANLILYSVECTSVNLMHTPHKK